MPSTPPSKLTKTLPSLPSAHSLNGDSNARQLHNAESPVPASDQASPPASAPSPPPRSAKRFSLSTNNATTTDQQNTAAKLAKLEIRNRVRDDWEWPPPQPSPSTSPPCSLNLPDSFTSWHERSEGFNTDLPEDSPSPPEYDSPSLTEGDPYRFHSPNDVTAIAAAPQQSERAADEADEKQEALSPSIQSRRREEWKRKRKRETKQSLAEEQTWNEGLRCFMQRRDAWSGARTFPHDNPTSKHDDLNEQNQNNAKDINGLITTTTPPPSSHQHLQSPSRPLHQPVMLVPHPHPSPPPTISPATYTAIYTKLVLRSLAPTIPINLADMVTALVGGWKEAGEWPPKSSYAAGGDGGDGDGKGGEGEGEGEGKGEEVGEGGGREGGAGGKRLQVARRGMGKVRRALGFRAAAGIGNGVGPGGKGDG